ncbi:MAG: hypothetical protein AAFN92_21600 [Bacteroidota bacterium]
MIATTQLPEQSATRGRDGEVRELIAQLFGNAGRENSAGGRAVFLPEPTAEKLAVALAGATPPADVVIATPPRPVPEFGKLSYIHKVKDGRDIYYFANSSDETVNSEVRLRGDHQLQEWNPHTGSIRSVTTSLSEESGNTFTNLRLSLPPVRSLFFVSTPRPGG